jgi:hypothetical protein
MLVERSAYPYLYMMKLQQHHCLLPNEFSSISNIRRRESRTCPSSNQSPIASQLHMPGSDETDEARESPLVLF